MSRFISSCLFSNKHIKQTAFYIIYGIIGLSYIEGLQCGA